jgi:hypothetical protein
MTVVLWHAEERASVERALDLGRGALAGVGPSSDVIVVAAALEGDARVAGAYQRLEDAVRVRDGVPVLRRETGGPAVVAGEGLVYLALALRDASTLMPCPRDRVLNRNVRPILGALRRIGASAHYFGREFVSVEKRPLGLVAWTRRAGGAVLLESVLGIDRPYVVPHEEQPLVLSSAHALGKVPITLSEVLASPPSAEALAQACAAACASMTPLEIGRAQVAPRSSEPSFVHEAMRWSRPHEVPIGFVRAGLARDARGVVLDAVLAGDFFQDADAPARLSAALVGGLATPERLRDAINATWGAQGAVIEGLRSLQPVLDAFLEVSGVDEETPPS